MNGFHQLVVWEVHLDKMRGRIEVGGKKTWKEVLDDHAWESVFGRKRTSYMIKVSQHVDITKQASDGNWTRTQEWLVQTPPLLHLRKCGEVRKFLGWRTVPLVSYAVPLSGAVEKGRLSERTLYHWDEKRAREHLMSHAAQCHSVSATLQHFPFLPHRLHPRVAVIFCRLCDDADAGRRWLRSSWQTMPMVEDGGGGDDTSLDGEDGEGVGRRARWCYSSRRSSVSSSLLLLLSISHQCGGSS